jgi:hypothetical protein
MLLEENNRVLLLHPDGTCKRCNVAVHMHSLAEVEPQRSKEVVRSTTGDSTACSVLKKEGKFQVSTIKDYKEVLAFFSSMTPSWDRCSWAKRVNLFNEHFHSSHQKGALRVLYNLAAVLKSRMEVDDAYSNEDSSALVAYIDFLCPTGDDTKLSQLKQVSVIPVQFT